MHLNLDTRYKDSYIRVDEVHRPSNHLHLDLKNYLSRVEAEAFPDEVIGIEELMEDYYHMNPPFEPKKPKEFKDAIMIKARKNYQKYIGEEIHILSDDEGFRTSFLNDKSFIVYQYHKKFLQFLSRRKEVCYAF
ncbi:MAG: PIN domain-containing protein [Enterocloster bolteae]